MSRGKLGNKRAISALAEWTPYDVSPTVAQSPGPGGPLNENGTRAKPLLLPGLEDFDPTVVRNAAIALVFFGCEEAHPELLKGLSHPDYHRRWEAVFNLKEVPSPKVSSA